MRLRQPDNAGNQRKGLWERICSFGCHKRALTNRATLNKHVFSLLVWRWQTKVPLVGTQTCKNYNNNIEPGQQADNCLPNCGLMSSAHYSGAINRVSWIETSNAASCYYLWYAQVEISSGCSSFGTNPLDLFHTSVDCREFNLTVIELHIGSDTFGEATIGTCGLGTGWSMAKSFYWQ